MISNQIKSILAITSMHRLVVASISGGLLPTLLTIVVAAANSTTHESKAAAAPIPAPSPIQLVLDTSGPPFDHVAAIEGTFGVPDPFPIVSIMSWINQGLDRNTRINVFVTNLELLPGETANDVRINLVDSSNQIFEVPATVVFPVPGMGFSQVIFRVPDNIATGKCTMTVRWQNQITNSGVVKIRPPKPKLDLRPARDTIYVPDNCPRTFVIKNTGPEGSTLDYVVNDPNGWIEISNRSGSLPSGVSANIIVRVHPDLLGDLDLLPTQTFVVLNTPDASNFTLFPIGIPIKNVSQIAAALLGTWSGTWSGTSAGRDNPGQVTPTTPVNGTWELNLQSVDTANGTAGGTLTWNGTDAYWTYSVNPDGSVLSTPHPFITDRTFPFNSSNTRLDNAGFGNCNQGHRFHLTINGPQPYGPTMFSIEMNGDFGTAVTTGNGFNANPYNSANGDSAFSHGIVTGSKVQ